MGKSKAGLLQGTLDMLILKALSLGALHVCMVTESVNGLHKSQTTRSRLRRVRCIRDFTGLNGADGSTRNGTSLTTISARSSTS